MRPWSLLGFHRASATAVDVVHAEGFQGRTRWLLPALLSASYLLLLPACSATFMPEQWAAWSKEIRLPEKTVVRRLGGGIVIAIYAFDLVRRRGLEPCSASAARIGHHGAYAWTWLWMVDWPSIGTPDALIAFVFVHGSFLLFNFVTHGLSARRHFVNKGSREFANLTLIRDVWTSIVCPLAWLADAAFICSHWHLFTSLERLIVPIAFVAFLVENGPRWWDSVNGAEAALMMRFAPV